MARAAGWWSDVDARTAYLKGWEASKRTTTCDLEAAEDRFLARYGGEWHDGFVAGWVDYACDWEKFTSLPTVRRSGGDR